MKIDAICRGSNPCLLVGSRSRLPRSRRTLVSVAMCLLAAWLAGVTVTDARADEFPEVIDTQKDPPRLSTPQEALAALKLPDGFRATLFAAEPDVRNPIAFTTDAAGRLWVAENYTYAERPVSRDERMRDRIVILTDKDGDGVSDQRAVFWDEATQLTSVEVGFGGVWALCPPKLLFLPDADGDDRPNGPPVVVLDGFDVGPANHHNFANGLKWGPDGWLYGRNGISNVGHVGPPGTPPEQRVEIAPGVWRFHPQTRAIELVCSGTTNPWGHDWNEHGELFFINTVIGHLWHAVPGAHFQRMFGADSNPNVYALLDHNADHKHWDTAEAWHETKKGMSRTTDQAGGGHAHSGLMIYLGGNWLPKYHGKMFTVNLHGRRLNCDRLEREGATYVGRHEPDLIFSSDPWFRAIDLIYGQDGGVFIADWSDVGECHENDGVHRSSGRIYKIVNAARRTVPATDIRSFSSAKLVELQLLQNEWYARQSRRLLQERAAAGQDLADAGAALEKMFAGEATEPTHRLRAMWCLNAIGGLSNERLLAALQHPDEHVRIWAVRLLVDRQPVAADLAAKLSAAFADRAKADDSGLVLQYLASAMQRLPTAERWPVAAALSAREDFANDRVLPLMIWYGIEGAVPSDVDRAVALATSARVPLVRRHVARRVAQDLASNPDGLRRLFAALNRASQPAADDPATQRDVLAGINDALRGWRKASPPETWPALHERLSKSPDDEIRRLDRELAVVFGDGRALDEIRELAKTAKGDLPSRRAAIRTLAEARAEGLAPLLAGLLSDPDVAPDAVRGLAVSGDPDTAKLLVDNYQRLHLMGREAAIETLTARPASARAMLEAIAAGGIDRAQVPVFQIRQMQGYDEPRVQELLRQLWPELRPITADKQARIASLKKSLSAEALKEADPSAGRVIWEKTCAKCHVLFGSGGKIGPDLTGSQRANLDYLLENIVDPSATLLANFRMSSLVLTDGRVLNGVVLSRNDQTLELQTPTDKLVLRVADIEATKDTGLSLMPDGQLDLLKPGEIRNLFAYLMATQQIPLLPPAGP